MLSKLWEMKKSNLYIIIFVIFLYGCNNNILVDKLALPVEMQQVIKTQFAAENFFVYYHSGECSVCYGTIMTISKEFLNVPIISISASKNAVLVEYYLKQIDFHGISILDSASLFLNRNQIVLSTESLFLIDSQYNIIVSGENYDKKTKKMLIHALR